MSTKVRAQPMAHPKARGRKVLAPVDTNPLAYDRTDPFTALNALRQLLAALPARVGGAQYKLSLDEHRVALHLLTIVEPFVGLLPSKRTLTRQPTEILDAIVFHVDSKRDLLNLALSCRRIHGIVFPRHYDYRVIRCKVSSLRVWNHLIVNRALARNVRRLEILDERDGGRESIPSDIMTTDTDMESTDDELGMHAKQEQFLASALTRMTALESLTWSCNHSPISMDDVWPTLLKCHSLKEVEISDNVIFNPVTTSLQETNTRKNTRRVVLHGLKTVGLHATKHNYGASRTPDLSRISGMLSNCPNLEVLNLDYVQRRVPGWLSPVADDFLMCSRWPHLRTLVLTNIYCTPHAGLDAAATFLFAHAGIEVLHLDVAFGAPTAGTSHAALKLPPNSLLRLRELKANRDTAAAIIACPCDAPGGRPLETLKGVHLAGAAADRGFLAALKLHASSALKRLELAGWSDVDDLKRLFECVPKLNWLDVGKRAGPTAPQVGGSGKQAAAAINTHAAEWASLLSRLPELATFHGVRFFYEVSGAAAPLSPSDRSRVRKNEEAAAIFTGRCPKLRRMDYWEEGAGRVIVLLRDGEKVRYEVRRVKA